MLPIFAASPFFRTLHTCAPYIIAGRTAAEYINLALLMEGPQVEVASLASASKAAVPLVADSFICSFQDPLRDPPPLRKVDKVVLVWCKFSSVACSPRNAFVVGH